MVDFPPAHFPLALRAPLLLPGPVDDRVTFIPDAGVIADERGIVTYIGPAASYRGEVNWTSAGLLIPPLLDVHIHIPQNPIRGRFLEGITGDEPEGPLLAGLARNVFPAEARCNDPAHAAEVVRQFLADTRAAGTLGGVAFMTSHPAAARAALTLLPKSWRVGLVLMDMNCSPELRIDPATATQAMRELAQDFGDRLVVTDRFAVACSTELRRAGVAVASEFGLFTQTHLSEQVGELAAIRRLYPSALDYTDVYDRDGLLTAGKGALLAHCIHLSDREWRTLAERGAAVAHCPVSNTALGSGRMPLNKAYDHGIDYALCTDVGASPTTSLLAEMSHFVSVHAGHSTRATPSAALFRTTESPRRIGKLDVGGIRMGEPFAAVELNTDPATLAEDVARGAGADDVIRRHLLAPNGLSIVETAQATSGKVHRFWEAA